MRQASTGACGPFPKASSHAVVLAGASRGGFLSVAYAAVGERWSSIVGVVNFVGGWVAQAEDNCPVDFNYTSFSALGAKTKVPMLWLYGENDAFYSWESIESYAKGFRASGATYASSSSKACQDVGRRQPDRKHRVGLKPDLQMVGDGYADALGMLPRGIDAPTIIARYAHASIKQNAGAVARAGVAIRIRRDRYEIPKIFSALPSASNDS